MRNKGRKLLAATVGLATVHFASACFRVGNLVCDASCGADYYPRDTGVVRFDSGPRDAGEPDAGDIDASDDAGVDDGGADAGDDAGVEDAGTDDGGEDAG
jgi:hypothetical protein